MLLVLHTFKAEKKSRRLLKKLPSLIAEQLASRDPNDKRPAVIVAQDEARFGRISDTRRAWAPEKTRPISPRQIIRKYVYVYAAVCPKLGKMTSLILPWTNTDMMNIFLKEVSEEFREYFVIMLIDQAGWHVSTYLDIPENIRVIRLPPYSPELNPSEHIWEELREKYFANVAIPLTPHR